MISVLIPIYNLNVTVLVEEIDTQFTRLGITHEIICLEDGSSKKHLIENNTIQNNKNVSYNISPVNKGRIISRKNLSSLAKYDWLLFLDADVEIKSNDYIKRYLEAISTDYDAIFGGFTYRDIMPKTDYRLRWKYGRSKEMVVASKRNRNPYKVVISANYMIKRKTFNDIYGKINYNGYGYDNYFGSLLKQENIKVLHIDNEVFHLGLEKNEIYLSKKEQAAQTLLILNRENKMLTHDNNLLRLYENLGKLGLYPIMSLLYRLLDKPLKRNLLGDRSYIPFLQLYRILFMCHLTKGKQKQ